MAKLSEKRRREIFQDELMPHINALHTFAYHLTYHDEDAADLVQETYLKAYKFLDKYDAGTNAKAWLFKILKNAYINDYRKKSRGPQKVELEDYTAYHDAEDTRIANYLDLREEIFDNLLGDEVDAALNSLPEDFKTVLLLCDIEGFTYEEMAKILEIPIGTVRSRLFRARNMLKEKLKSYAIKLGYKDYRSKDKSESE